MSRYEARLRALREELVRRSLGGFAVPLTDEHMSEYVGSYAQRLAWLTGFDGSAGTAVVLAAEAAMFVDGRYTVQVRQQVDARSWSFHTVPQDDPVRWIEEHVPEGTRFGYDPWLHTKGWAMQARQALERRGGELVALATNPIDVVWTDRPEPSAEKIVVHPMEAAGRSCAEKRRGIAEWLVSQKADATILSALDSIAWTFNIRGRDVKHTPVALAYAIVHSDGTADLFVAPDKVTAEVRQHLGDSVRLHSRAAFERFLRELRDRKVAVDPQRAVAAIFEALSAGGARVIEARDPVVLPKAIKNPVEIACHKAAQARDGAALTRFLYWLSVQAPRGSLSEMSAAAKLREFREATGRLLDLSFDTISGFGPNGAVVHYRATEETNRAILPGSLYLIDSGGQYLDGTTDVTRTVAIGTPNAEMRDRFTRVLKGHIAMASAVFPVGTRGVQIDAIVRQHLWAAGLDFAHGTGHGVGSYLGVHEGPQRIAQTGNSEEPLVAGMIVSNEPGYYKTGDYGIRIENLVLVVKRELTGAEREMLGFETLTFAPIDRALIEGSLLTVQERAWLDSYHGDVARIIGPQLDTAERAWLLGATRPLE